MRFYVHRARLQSIPMAGPANQDRRSYQSSLGSVTLPRESYSKNHSSRSAGQRGSTEERSPEDQGSPEQPSPSRQDRQSSEDFQGRGHPSIGSTRVEVIRAARVTRAERIPRQRSSEQMISRQDTRVSRITGTEVTRERISRGHPNSEDHSNRDFLAKVTRAVRIIPA